MMTSIPGRIKEERQPIATLLALALIPLSGFAIDIYVPSLPDMGADLHTGSSWVQLTITVFLISYGISQLFVGSILDSFGRFNIALSSLIVFSASCVVIAVTHNIYLICCMRVIHGITVAAI